MDRPSEEDLLQRILEHKEQDSFESLIIRYEQPLLSLIRIRLGTSERADIEDVFQDTLLQAWLSLIRSSPANFQAWLYQLARNRCSDWQRSRAKTQIVREAATVRHFMDRRGPKISDDSDRIDEIVDVLRHVPVRERKALTEFYFQGFSIAEIAARQRTAQGTIKRRLSYGREIVRSELDLPTQKRTQIMKPRTETLESLPPIRPSISISKSMSEPFEVDLQEMAWWFIVPKIGDAVRWATYEATENGQTFCLKSVHSMHAKCAAEIHGRACVEVEVDEQEANSDRSFVSFPNGDKSLRIWGGLTDSEVHWIAHESGRTDGKKMFYTFLDKGWDQDFGVCERTIAIHNFLEEMKDQSCNLPPELPRLFADRAFDVSVGDTESVECMRVFELDSDPSESDVLIEAYVNRDGRTVLARRYNGNRWAKVKDSPHFLGTQDTWTEEFPSAPTKTINGVVYVHYEDFLRIESRNRS
ncbi:MAG: sigma-70 family RNA polymerase sigma factor [Gammaproteobacteria bacterium]|nr:sigma-70 family RNA polymerase sigma factor [Gammaproteobacteria bacterium]